VSGRLEKRFAALRGEGRGGLVAFITAGDPDAETSRAILDGLPGAGADVIELGMPFTDPVADGPAIQAASVRALAAGATMKQTLALVRGFRESDDATPIVLMGYYNPIHRYGVEAFARDAGAAGVDGLIIVDLPPEEEAELRVPAAASGIDIIRLIAPTTDDARLPRVLEGTGGFVYYVSVAGVTGGKTATEATVAAAVERIRGHTSLPVAVGFGITTPEGAGAVARLADAAVVGSAFVRIIADNLDGDGGPAPGLAGKVLDFAAEMSAGIRGARAT
jgi:tryptophan synthase alpha chain